MGGFFERISWIAAGRAREPENAFDWIRGRVGSRQNPDGMRSLIHAGIVLAVCCIAVDLAVLWRNGWVFWEVFAFLHTIWIASLMVATVLNVGFLETLDGRCMKSLGGPNLLTLVRGFLLPALVYLLAVQDFALGVFIYAAATATDAVDGWWARRAGLRSKLGVVADPIMDLFLHLFVFATLGMVGLLGRTALVLILVRSGLVIFGTGVLYFWKGQVRIQPTPFGKATGLLLTLATILLLGLAGLAPGEAVGLMRFLSGFLTVMLGLCVLHVLAMGVINLTRPPAEGIDPPRARGPRS